MVSNEGAGELPEGGGARKKSIALLLYPFILA